MKPSKPLTARKLTLLEGWTVQSSKMAPDGAQVSVPGFKTSGWHPTDLPSTVLGTLVANKVYEDPTYGMNLRKLPGMNYNLGENFSLAPMNPDSPFASPWWFRKEFKISDPCPDEHFRFHFDGINYAANIWVNGQKMADRLETCGTYRHFDFDITPFARLGTVAVAVELVAPPSATLSFSWIDWNPMPPDKDMGLWRDVYVTRSGPVSLENPKVITDLDIPSLKTARLTVLATCRNNTDKNVKGVLTGTIGKIRFSQPVSLKAGETKEVPFTPSRFSKLKIKNPKLWWPYQMGAQEMHLLELEFRIGDKASDKMAQRFGIRRATSEMVDGQYRLFSINGKRILIRGAGWAPDLLFRVSPEREEQEVRYVRDMGLNTIRFEGSVASQHLLDLCDERGILVMAGWQCCCHWERWNEWRPEDHKIAEASLKDEVRRLFNHPSVFVWVNGSDYEPPDLVLKVYTAALEDEGWPNPHIASARTGETYQGKTGVKMTGPYQYVPPAYWYTDTQRGGAFGFNTETSMGPSIPPVESLQKMMPKDQLWPIGEHWIFHCGGGPFRSLDIFNRALERRYGKATSLKEYVTKAQALVYDGHRAMFEAYEKNKYKNATGVIQWMLNNAWPSMYWHLYDYYLRPGSAYFAAKKANEPLHLLYAYDDRSVVVTNNNYTPLKKARVKARVFDFDLNEKFVQEKVLDIPADSSVPVLTLPELEGISTTYFVRLDASDPKGKPVTTNFYWLSTQNEVYDYESTEFHSTPVTRDADMTMLNQLPKAKIVLTLKSKKSGKEKGITTVSVKNAGKTLAFFVRLKLLGKGKEEVLPILWQDNYFSLLPGEKRDIQASYQLKDLRGAMPVVKAEGWNL